ncbi:unnamed protein product [Closterium sp. Yama58-4]|nr:unnamed protein product [Closterium sp. Yama58-4]
MYAGTVGTIIANNFITDFQFGAVQCGQGDGNVADCMLNTIQDNLITAESTIYPVPNGDGSGIYYDLHWYNPGNLDTCNYIIGGTHCYYLDFVTSGLTIDGAVCIRNHDGVKINTGHAVETPHLIPIGFSVIPLASSFIALLLTPLAASFPHPLPRSFLLCLRRPPLLHIRSPTLPALPTPPTPPQQQDPECDCGEADVAVGHHELSELVRQQLQLLGGERARPQVVYHLHLALRNAWLAQGTMQFESADKSQGSALSGIPPSSQSSKRLAGARHPMQPHISTRPSFLSHSPSPATASPSFQNWPFLSDLCHRTEWAPGIPCNPTPPVEAAKNWTGYCSQHLHYNNGKQLSASANVTANCSGVPGLNHVEMIVINGTGNRWNPYYINCDALPSVRPTNNITTTSINYPWGFFDFDNATGEDFGVSNLSSRMYQLYPHFMTCSRRRAGIQRQMRALSAAASTIQSSFGVNPASWWHDVYASVPYNKEMSNRIVSEKLLKRISTNRPRQNPGQKEKKPGNGGMGFQKPTIPIGGGGGSKEGWSLGNWWTRRKTLERGGGSAGADDEEVEEESAEQEGGFVEQETEVRNSGEETRHEHFNVLEYDPYAGGEDRLGGNAFDHLWI